jgi:hypothetical protein
MGFVFGKQGKTHSGQCVALISSHESGDAQLKLDIDSTDSTGTVANQEWRCSDCSKQMMQTIR